MAKLTIPVINQPKVYTLSKAPGETLKAVTLVMAAGLLDSETISSVDYDDADTGIVAAAVANGQTVEVDLAAGNNGDQILITITATGTLGSIRKAVLFLSVVDPAEQVAEAVMYINRAINWKGDWSDTDTYMRGDVTRYGAGSWIALRSNTDVQPVAGDDWAEMVDIAAAEAARDDAQAAATAAGDSATAADAAAGVATQKAIDAGDSATAADQSTTAAAGSATLAGQKAVEAGDAAALAGQKAGEASIYAGQAAGSAGDAQAAKVAAEAVAVDATAVVTGGTGSLTPEAGKFPIGDSKGLIDLGWVLGLPTKAEFEAAAATRRNQYAGSGVIEPGKHQTSNPYVNEGVYMWAGLANGLYMGLATSATGVGGVSRTFHPVFNVHGYELHIRGVNRSILSGNSGNQINLPAAPETLELANRIDLVMLEVWHELVSLKGVLYAFGNVHFTDTGYTAPDGTYMPCSNGTFPGANTYSLHGVWQGAGTQYGRGISLSSITKEQLSAFVAAPENNCYRDGSNLVQVRFRIRVLPGPGVYWQSLSTMLAANSSVVQYDINNRVSPQGMMVTPVYGVDFKTPTSGFGQTQYYIPSTDNQTTPGAWHAFQNVPLPRLLDPQVGYLGKCWAMPLLLVKRRNKGAYHPYWNRNGTAYVNRTVASGKWYEATAIPYVSAADAFNFVSSQDTFTPGANANTGDIASGLSGRPDGRFYDEVNEADILDLRTSAHKIHDFCRLNSKAEDSLVGNLVRGWQPSLQIPLVTLGTVAYGAGGSPAGTNFNGYLNNIDHRPQNYPMRYLDVKGARFFYVGVMYRFTDWATSLGYIRIQKWDGAAWIDGDFTADIPTGAQVKLLLPRAPLFTTIANTDDYSRSNLCCDIFGDPQSLPASWTDPTTPEMSGVPVFVAEDGSSLIPDGTAKTFKLSRKCSGSPVLLLYTADSGATWVLGVATDYGWSVTANGYVSTGGGVATQGRVTLVFYLSDASPLQQVSNLSDVVAFSKFVRRLKTNDARYGGNLVSWLLGKVPTSSDGRSSKLTIQEFEYNDLFAKHSYLTPIVHSSSSFSGAAWTPCSKIATFIGRYNGQAALFVLYKEMIYSTNWGEDNTLPIVGGDSTVLDTNSKTCKYGCRIVLLPFIMADGD